MLGLNTADMTISTGNTGMEFTIWKINIMIESTLPPK